MKYFDYLPDPDVAVGGSLIIKAALPSLRASLEGAALTRRAQLELMRPTTSAGRSSTPELETALERLRRLPPPSALLVKADGAAQPRRLLRPEVTRSGRPEALLRPLFYGGAVSYFDFRDRLASDIQHGRVRPTPAAMVAHATTRYGLANVEAAEWTERFLQDGVRLRLLLARHRNVARRAA